MTATGPVWLIANAASGSHDGPAIDAISGLFAEAGRPIARRITLGEAPLPTGEEARTAGAGLIIIHGGDGTISSVTDRLGDWPGEILVLPGGTMNLLSRALHGELPALEIARLAAHGDLVSVPIPIIAGEGYHALAGIVAGPTSAWGEVREHLRNADLAGLAASVPEALDETLSSDGITVDGVEEAFEAVYLQPALQSAAAGLDLRGIVAKNAGDLIAHGWAWLAGDFRKGPSVDLGMATQATLRGHGNIGLLVDGEKAEAGWVATFRAALSPQRFLSCRGGIHWD
jgi:hypothetical protein